jgi:hypothetical protein
LENDVVEKEVAENPNLKMVTGGRYIKKKKEKWGED